MRRRSLLIAVAALSLGFSALSTVSPAVAQTWPSRPVKFIVSIGQGSGSDISARLLAERLSSRWGQPVVVENRPGGDAVIAINALIAAHDDRRSRKRAFRRWRSTASRA